MIKSQAPEEKKSKQKPKPMTEKEKKKKAFEDKMKHKISKYIGKIEEIQILQNDPKIGPSSFVLHLLLGSGSFGEVYLV